MKNVLILSCSTGEGHNSAAYAIRNTLQQQGISCEVADPVSFQSKRMERLVASLYNDTIRKAPAVFGAVYKLGDFYCATRLPSPVYWANAHYSEALRQYILQHGFDTVICTHLYGMEAMTALRKRKNFPIPCYGVLTDYTCIPFIEETDLNGFFVPHREAKEYLMGKGIPEERICISGIPVSPVFRSHPEKQQARQELHIPQNKKVYLIMTGGIGCENMHSLCRGMLEKLDENSLMIVLVGKNQELKMKLDARYGGDSRMRTVSFTKQVADYMAASDVLLSKPGGLSSTEAAVANIPLVHIHAIPGCETYNARFFSSHGMSVAAETEAEAIRSAIALAHDPEAAQQMRQNQRTYVNAQAADLIVRKVGESWNKTSLFRG